MSLRDPRFENQEVNVPTFVGNIKLVIGHCRRSNSVAASAGLSAPSSIVTKTTLSFVGILYSTFACGNSVADRGYELIETMDPKTIEAMKTRRIMSATLGHGAKVFLRSDEIQREN